DISPNASAFVNQMNEKYDESLLDGLAYDYAAAYHDAVVLLAMAIESTGSTDGDVITEWLETEGPSAAEENSIIVHEDLAMSDSNHFLMDTSSMALVNPGKEMDEQIFERLDCD